MADRNRLITAGSRVRMRLAADDRLVAAVRRGDSAAFEAVYERHSGELFSFCVYMLGSRHDAEDAVQATFASAYRALRADRRPVSLRPWLFTIARNDCLSILRRRRPWVELNGEPALRGDPFRELELREEVRQTLDGLRRLPESQRAALVLAEMHGLSQVEIAEVLGVRTEQVKAFVYQARSNLVSERKARETDCREIREELATARGTALLRGRLRRHVRSCADCRVYADGVARQRRHLGALMPLVPSLMLRYRALEDALGIGTADPATYAGGAAIGASVAGTAAQVAGGGVKALAVKMAAGMAALGASAGVGASVLSGPVTPEAPTTPSSIATRANLPLAAAIGTTGTIGLSPVNSGASRSSAGRAGGRSGQPSTVGTKTGGPGAKDGGGSESAPGNPSAGPESRTNGRERQPKGTGRPPKNEPQQGKGATHTPKTEEELQRQHRERQLAMEERKLAAEERKLASEERKRRREEPEAVSRPPRTKEERELQRAERLRRHEERERIRQESKAGAPGP